MNAKFTQNRLDMHLTYFYMCFFVRLAKKFMNHELYFIERANDPGLDVGLSCGRYGFKSPKGDMFLYNLFASFFYLREKMRQFFLSISDQIFFTFFLIDVKEKNHTHTHTPK